MSRTISFLFVVALCAGTSAVFGGDSSTAKQPFVVRVPAKVTVTSNSLPAQTLPNSEAETQTTNAVDVAEFQVAGTSQAGLIVQFEVVWKSPPFRLVGAHSNESPKVSLRSSGKADWNFNVDAVNAHSMIAEADSNGIGAATLRLATDGRPRALQITTTVIPKE